MAFDLVKEASKVHQTTLTVPAKRGTIYDRNGTPIAEDATSYNVYAVIDKDYKSANGDILYVEESQYNKVAEISISTWIWRRPMSKINSLNRISNRFLLVLKEMGLPMLI